MTRLGPNLETKTCAMHRDALTRGRDAWTLGRDEGYFLLSVVWRFPESARGGRRRRVSWLRTKYLSWYKSINYYPLSNIFFPFHTAHVRTPMVSVYVCASVLGVQGCMCVCFPRSYSLQVFGPPDNFLLNIPRELGEHFNFLKFPYSLWHKTFTFLASHYASCSLTYCLSTHSSCL